MLSKPDEAEVLYVVAVGSEHIVGPLSWDSVDLSIAEHGTSESVRDVKAGFELRCSSTTLVRGPSTDYETTFDGFMSERPDE
jgi:hypothetical protein